MCPDAALGEKSQRLAGLSTLLDPENLYFQTVVSE